MTSNPPVMAFVMNHRVEWQEEDGSEPARSCRQMTRNLRAEAGRVGGDACESAGVAGGRLAIELPGWTWEGEGSDVGKSSRARWAMALTSMCRQWLIVWALARVRACCLGMAYLVVLLDPPGRWRPGSAGTVADPLAVPDEAVIWQCWLDRGFDADGAMPENAVHSTWIRPPRPSGFRSACT